MKTCTICRKELPEDQFKIKRNGKINMNCMTCIDKVREKYQANKPAKQKYQRERYHNNPEVQQAQKDWFDSNPGYIGKYFADRKATDALFKLRVEACGRLHYWATVCKKLDKFMDEIGCTPAELRAHIESLFQHGMTWENCGRDGWQLDHKFPLSIAVGYGEQVLKKALNYKNVQPLWEKDNYEKYNYVPSEWPTIEDFMKAW